MTQEKSETGGMNIDPEYTFKTEEELLEDEEFWGDTGAFKITTYEEYRTWLSLQGYIPWYPY